jgi:drug/metabolite transporter (DMT)-like permease
MLAKRVALNIGIALALLSAATTAIPHALLKSGKDKLAVRAVLGAVQTTLIAPLCLFVPSPSGTMLPWVVASCTLHAVYQFVLIRAYDATDFAVAYPIARGTAPIATAMLGALLLGDRLSLTALFGVALVSLGIVLIGLGQRLAPAGLLAAAIAGLLITAYTTVDAGAIRMGPSAFTFIVWFFALDGLTMFSLFAMLRGRRIGALIRPEAKLGIIAGLTSLISCGAALLALRFAPVGIVSALRETSVLFAMVIAALCLRERVDRRHVIAAIIIAIGACAIILSPV